MTDPTKSPQTTQYSTNNVHSGMAHFLGWYILIEIFMSRQGPPSLLTDRDLGAGLEKVPAAGTHQIVYSKARIDVRTECTE